MEEEDEEGSVEEHEEEEEEEKWEKALSVERFGDIISDQSASTSGERMGRHYTEKDFECKQNYLMWCRMLCLHLSLYVHLLTFALSSASWVFIHNRQ